MPRRLLPILTALCLALPASAEERLPSNFLAGVAAADGGDAVWVWSAEGASGAALVGLSAEGNRVRARSIEPTGTLEAPIAPPGYPRQFVDWRRSGAPAAVAGNLLAAPAAGDVGGGFDGFHRIDAADVADGSALLRVPLPASGDDEPFAARTAAARGDTVWISLGAGGVAALVRLSSLSDWALVRAAVDTAALSWSVRETCDGDRSCGEGALGTPVHTLQADSSALFVEAGRNRYELRAGGKLKRVDDGLPLGSKESRAGLWRCGSREWAQGVRVRDGKTTTSLWTRRGSGAWTRADSARWDSLAVFLVDLACVDTVAWGAVQSFESYRDGLLRLEGKGAEMVEIPGSRVPFSGVAAFSCGTGRRCLAGASFGAGLALSADSGRTWSSVLNRASVKGELKEIRCIPSVVAEDGVVSKIAYRVGKKSKVTIEVFSYDMLKVRTVVRSAPRFADPVRSSDPSEDVWDGRDDDGRAVSSGLYYVRVKDDRGHEGWGKIYRTAGPR